MESPLEQFLPGMGGALDRLARRMQRGDAKAADTLYRELSPKVFGFCMK